MWDTINDNLYKAANLIVSHCFFNDAYEDRLRIQSPRFKQIRDSLRNAKRNKLGESEIKELKSEREQLFDEFKNNVTRSCAAALLKVPTLNKILHTESQAIFF